MKTVVVTGSAGLVGSQAVRFFAEKGWHVVGIDNDMRRTFFGPAASTEPCRRRLQQSVAHYVHYDVDVRDRERVKPIFAEHGRDVQALIHAAAQPSHDWAAKDPATDFSVNATGTLLLLEMTRQYCPGACFVFTSTNKVYGDNPNRLPLVEQPTRWEVEAGHLFHEHGIDESMSVDHAMHSVFGASKLAADVMVQEYGRYFGLNTVAFRCGCITGADHAGAELHGFLSYLVLCAVKERPYTIFGYQGKQVRDNIHAFDLVNMFWHYCQAPRPGEVYNAGGGRHSHCSMREAIDACERVTGKRMRVTQSERNRAGDHVWYVSDTRKFQSHYPEWHYAFTLERIMEELCQSCSARAEE
jgi:CDP-paratose 2-epimerase